MREIVEMTGRSFGDWTVVARGQNPKKWVCRCSCGTEREVVGTSLRFGHSTNCGCRRKETLRAMKTVHGGKGTPEYRVWKHMRGRCNDPNDKRFDHYGGRGIKVCGRWNDFAAFLADMGLRPSADHSIERLNVDGNYEPSNCIWATAVVQARNKTTTAYIKIGDRVGKVLALAEELGIPYYTLFKRAQRGSFGVTFVPQPS